MLRSGLAPVDPPPAMLRRALLPLLALGAAYLAVAGLIELFTSDETKIRRLVAQMEEAYNDGDPGDCVEPLAADWRHEGHELDRQMLFGALLQTARERDRETKQLRTRVEIDEDATVIVVDGDRATFTCDAVFFRLRAGAWAESWRMRAEAELVDGDYGWEIVRSRHADERGTHLGR